jgi:Zn-finger nucleic acid-binding protein
MDCPVCKNAMITLEIADVEIDYCTDCGGIWLDAGEMELLLGERGKAKQLLDSFKPVLSKACPEHRRRVEGIDAKFSERARKCPICDKKMLKIIVGSSEPALLIDKCQKGDGLWFDKNELQDIVDRAELDKNNKIQKLLADMFGHSRQG